MGIKTDIDDREREREREEKSQKSEGDTHMQKQNFEVTPGTPTQVEHRQVSCRSVNKRRIHSKTT